MSSPLRAYLSCFLSIHDYPTFMVIINIVLALIPLIFSSYLATKIWKKENTKIKAFLILCFILWFLFFPNAPYMISLVRHLLDYCPVGSPNRVCLEGAYLMPLFFIYAVIGIFPFVKSLKQVSRFLGQNVHPFVGKTFPVFVMPFTAAGILIGLIERWHSINLFTSPLLVLTDLFSYISDPQKLFTLITYTVSLYILFYGFRFAIR